MQRVSEGGSACTRLALRAQPDNWLRRVFAGAAAAEAADLQRALQHVSSHTALVELPSGVRKGIAAWLSGPSAPAGRSIRQLRAESGRLLSALRARSRGFPAAPLPPTPVSRSASAVMTPHALSRLLSNVESGRNDVVAAPRYTDSEVSQYAATRLPCTFASLHRVFAELATLRPGARPASLLDWGAGPGTAALAAASVWPNALHTVVHVEQSGAMLSLADTLRSAWEGNEAPPPPTVHSSVLRLRGPAFHRSFDLVVASYALGEASEAEQAGLLRRLWAHTRSFLIIIEPGTPKGSAIVRAARRRVLGIAAKAGRGAGVESERKLLDTASVVAPCPHDGPCPMDADPLSWCHFTVRVHRPREARLAKGGASRPAGSFQDERFSYVVLQRGERAGDHTLRLGGDAALGAAYADDRDVDAPSPEALAHAVRNAASGWGRLVRPPRPRARHVVLDLCARSGQLERRIVAPSHDARLMPGAYRQARKARWGDTWPWN